MRSKVGANQTPRDFNLTLQVNLASSSTSKAILSSSSMVMLSNNSMGSRRSNKHLRTAQVRGTQATAVLSTADHTKSHTVTPTASCPLP